MEQCPLRDFFHFEVTAQLSVSVLLVFPLNDGGLVSDQLALAANVRLRKYHSYIRYGNV